MRLIPSITLALLLCIANLTASAKENMQPAEENLQPAYIEEQENEQPADAPREYFPKAGDFSIGFDSTPFLNYIGNMFNGTANNTLNLSDNTLHFRYHITDNSAARVSFNVASFKDMDKFYVDDQASQAEDPLSRAQVEDMRLIYTNNYAIKAGYLIFRGENRLRGFVGGDVFYMYGKERGEFAYGNDMTEANSAPETVVNWNNGNTADQDMRILEYSSGSTMEFGVGALVGAEFFFAPKISIGAEMGLLYGYTLISQANESYERMVESMHVREDFELAPGINERAAISAFPITFGNLYLLISF